MSEENVEAMFHADESSFGVYPFPLHATRVDNVPADWKGTENVSGRYGFGKLQGTIFTPEADFVPEGVVRSNPWLKSEMLSWLRVAPSTAPLVLVQALPGFWLNRHRLTSEIREALASRRKIDLSVALQRRQPLRALLAEHSSSLASKLWGLEYHHGRFNDCIAAARGGTKNPHFDLVAAAAEFRSYAETVYSLLEETTRAAAILYRIATGQSGQQSFHKLHADSARAPAELRKILDGATWYEKFRLRRANSAHAFGATLAKQGDDLSLYQHPDALIYAGAKLKPPKADNAVSAFEELSGPFRPFLAAYSAYLLSLFHPWDIVVIPHMPLEGGEPNLRPVWTRRVEFDPSHERPSSSWALMDESNAVAFRTVPGGGIKKEV